MNDEQTATPASGSRIVPQTTTQALAGIRLAICTALGLEPAALPMPSDVARDAQATWSLPADRGTVIASAHRMMTGKTQLKLEWYGSANDDQPNAQRQQLVDQWLRDL